MASPTVHELARRVLAKCERDDQGCLVFQGALAKGYGRVGYYSDDKRQVVLQAHRVVWEATNGPIPDGLTIEHECATRACQDIGHMTLMTLGDNARAGAHRNPVVIANRAKTHCPAGHPYDEENTYRPPGGGRYCRTCGRAARRAYYYETWREKRRAASRTENDD